MYKFIDLFAGIGGFRVALQKRGMKCVFSSEIDNRAKSVYERNFDEEIAGDICEIEAKDIPAHDILCAGFPCQSFSISGKRHGMKDKSGRLFYEIVRIAQYHKPYVLLLENVKNILSIDNGKVLETIKFELHQLGYEIYISIINASDCGILQSRKRVFFICLLKGSNLKYKHP